MSAPMSASLVGGCSSSIIEAEGLWFSSIFVRCRFSMFDLLVDILEEARTGLGSSLGAGEGKTAAVDLII